MKTIITMALLGTSLLAAPLRAQESNQKEEMACCAKCGEEKMKQMENKMKAEAAELDKLVDEMNASTGEKKLAAMAAVINKMLQLHKGTHGKMGEMMMMGMVKKDGKQAAKPDELDYYTCKMHPAVHWPIPGKCPICSMDLVPVSTKPSDAKPEAQDPHTGQH